MKRLTLALLLGVLVALVLAGCPKKQQPVEEVPPPVTQQEPEPQPEPEPVVEEPAPSLEESQLQTVYYDFDKYNLRSDARRALDANAELLKQFSNVIVRIEGHADERGTNEYNLSLGEKRARSAMDYLAGLGIDPGRMSTISYGEERPAAQGSNENAWAQNRRAEFRIVSQ